MSRLTECKENGEWGLKEVPWQQLTAGVVMTEETRQKLYGALCKLKDYEDTGLDPDKIRQQDELYLEKCKEAAGKWIPVDERYPDNEDYILVSFDNYSLPDIAMYKTDDEGGAFYPADEERSYVSFGLFVNAWMPLPKRYKEQEQVEGVPEHTKWLKNFKREFEEVL